MAERLLKPRQRRRDEAFYLALHRVVLVTIYTGNGDGLSIDQQLSILDLHSSIGIWIEVCIHKKELWSL